MLLISIDWSQKFLRILVLNKLLYLFLILFKLFSNVPIFGLKHFARWTLIVNYYIFASLPRRYSYNHIVDWWATLDTYLFISLPGAHRFGRGVLWLEIFRKSAYLFRIQNFFWGTNRYFARRFFHMGIVWVLAEILTVFIFTRMWNLIPWLLLLSMKAFKLLATLRVLLLLLTPSLLSHFLRALVIRMR